MQVRKLFFYLIILKKVCLLAIYPIFERRGKLFASVRKNIENYLIFQPSKLRARRINRTLLKKINPQRFVTSDGVKLYAWFIKPKNNMPVFLHLHGQAESILSYQDIANYCIEKGFGLYLLSYRGHYKSCGTPSERGLYKDAQSAILQLKKLGVEQDKIIIWGHSLGTVIAFETAVYNKVMGVIVQSPIKEIKTAAIDVYNFYCKRLHLDFLARFARKHIMQMHFMQKMDNSTKIRAVKCPILILHSKNDKVAPYNNSVELASQNPLAQLYIADYGSHWDSGWCMEKVFEFATSLDYTGLGKSDKVKGEKGKQ